MRILLLLLSLLHIVHWRLNFFVAHCSLWVINSWFFHSGVCCCTLYAMQLQRDKKARLTNEWKIFKFLLNTDALLQFHVDVVLCASPFSHTNKKTVRLDCNKNFASWAKTIRAARDSNWFFMYIRYHTFPPWAFSAVVSFLVRLLIWFQSVFFCMLCAVCS